MGEEIGLAFSVIGILVVVGFGWYKFAYNNALKNVQDEYIDEQERLIVRAKKAQDDIADMDRTERNHHNNDWT